MKNSFIYNIGMYGGSFDPLHTGHLSVIFKAASECKELYLVLSYSLKRDNIFYKTRLQWLYAATEHFNNVKILWIEDTCKTKDEYKEADWYEGSVKIKKLIGKKIDVIYCGDDYNWNGSPYKKFYNESTLNFINRDIIPISSSELRNNIFKYWDYLPLFVRPTYVKKILICGVESTGKSTLTTTLAKYFCTNAVSEYGRNVCQRCGSEHAMTLHDFEEIIYKHKCNIIDLTRTANKLLFIDTDALTTYFYATYNKDINIDSIVFDKNIIKKIIDDYDLILICNTDVPFVDDGLRIENRNKSRDTLDEWFKSEYYNIINDTNKIINLTGNYSEKLSKAIQEINTKLLNI